MHQGNLLSVYVFNVGQGDNILIRLPDDSYGLVDFHYDPAIHGQHEPPSLHFLKQLKEVKIKFIHLSHYHKDHTKGLPFLMEWLVANDIPVEYLWLPACLSPDFMKQRFSAIIEDTEIMKKILAEEPGLASYYNDINKKHGSSLFVKLENYVDDRIKKGFDGLEYLNNVVILPNCCNAPHKIASYCLAPTSKRSTQFTQKKVEEILKVLFKSREKDTTDGNDISSILMLQVNATKLLFGGDAKLNSIEDIIRIIKSTPERLPGLEDISADFIKIFHHGSKKSSSEQLWEQLLVKDKETHIAISAGVQSYEHPDKETIDHIFLADGNPRVYATNHDYLSQRGETRHHIPQEVEALNWAHFSNSIMETRDDRFRAINDHSFVNSNVTSPAHSQFWGYCFEFNLDNNEVNVKQLVN
jgi:beta-lactamase superfamily II metal-dependent hydrolase